MDRKYFLLDSDYDGDIHRRVLLDPGSGKGGARIPRVLEIIVSKTRFQRQGRQLVGFLGADHALLDLVFERGLGRVVEIISIPTEPELGARSLASQVLMVVVQLRRIKADVVDVSGEVLEMTRGASYPDASTS